MSIESAELTKVAYNTWISAKLVLTQSITELADKTGADAWEVMDALSRASKRITSGAYMSPGMGDSGPCHPRDLIALSSLAQSLDIAYDPWTYLVRAREARSLALAQKVITAARSTHRPVIILGRAYKPNIPLEDGSTSLLLAHDITSAGLGVSFIDPDCGYPFPETLPQAVYVVALPNFATISFPPDSIVFDPWGVVQASDTFTLIQPGRG